MPAAIVAVGAIAAGSAATAAAVAAGWVVAGGIGAAIIGGVTSMAVSAMLGNAMGLNKQQDQGSSSQQSSMARGLLINTASTIDPIPVVYGSRRVGGSRVLTEVSGDSNEYLHLVITLGEGPISAINTVYIDGVDSSDARFSGLVSIEKYLGAHDQAASAGLMAALPGKWTSAHRGLGVAYIWVRLKFNQDAFSGLPTITADVDGRTLYDPRDTLTKFSSNPALCVRDYLTNSLYGRGVSSSGLDEASWISGANTCDVTYTDPQSVARATHTCNGVVNTDENTLENMRQMLTSCRGSLLYSARGYGLLVDKAETPTTFEFNEDNIVGQWQISAGSKRTRFNRVRGNWYNPDRDWQPDIWPADSTVFRAADNGLLLEAQIELPFTTNTYEAQIKTERHLRQSRFGQALTFRATIAGLDCEVGDVVPLTHSTPGYVSKPFRVARMTLASSDEVEVEVAEYDDSVYSVTPLTTPRATPATSLPDPFTVPAPGVPSVTETLYETTGSAGVKSRASMSWAAVENAFVTRYLPEYKLAAVSVWTTLPATTSTSVDIEDLAPGNYQFRVRAENSMGVRGAYSATTTKTLLGLTAPPADVTGFSVTKSAGIGRAEWSLHADLDVRQGGIICIRHSPLTTGALWENGVIVQEFSGNAVSGDLPLMTGTYMAKARDSSNPANWSTNAVSFVATEGMVTGFTTVASSIQHATFAGAKSNVAVMDGALRLAGLSTISGMATPVSEWGKISSLGGISATGSYTFDAVLDLTTVATRRFEADIAVTCFDTGDTIAQRGLVSGWGSVAGQVINDCDATLYISTTDDDPAGSPTWGPWTPFFVGDFTCRAARKKLDLASGQPTHNIRVSTLRVDVKEPV